MRSWKKKFSTTVSLEQFKNLWRAYTLKKKNISAFEAYKMFIAQKEPGFKELTDPQQISRYKQDLNLWGLTR